MRLSLAIGPNLRYLVLYEDIAVRVYEPNLWLLVSMCIYQWLLVIHTFRERKPLVGAGFLPTLPGTTRGKTMRPNLSLSLLISCRPSYKPIRGGLLITPSDGHLNITDPPLHSQTPHTVLSVLNYVRVRVRTSVLTDTSWTQISQHVYVFYLAWLNTIWVII